MPGGRSAERCCRLVVRTWRRIERCAAAAWWREEKKKKKEKTHSRVFSQPQLRFVKRKWSAQSYIIPVPSALELRHGCTVQNHWAFRIADETFRCCTELSVWSKGGGNDCKCSAMQRLFSWLDRRGRMTECRRHNLCVSCSVSCNDT